MFPSDGLQLYQLLEAIKECGLAPDVSVGDLANGAGTTLFSRTRLAATSASLIRSGYPVLIVGSLGTPTAPERHAVCAVAFREAPAPITPGRLALQDGLVKHLYVHDDNLGPAARMEISEDQNGFCCLQTSSPPATGKRLPGDPTAGYGPLFPHQLVAAVHPGIRVSADTLINQGAGTAHLWMQGAVAGQLPTGKAAATTGMSLSFRLLKAHEYLGEELPRLLGGDRQILARTRMRIVRDLPPLSLHVGVARVGLGPAPLLDILYDTTDRNIRPPALGHVALRPDVEALCRALERKHVGAFGPGVAAH